MYIVNIYYILVDEIRQGEGSRGLDRIATRCPNLLILIIGSIFIN